MNILGISAYYHDSAACLVRSGEIVSAAQEERFTRLKHDARFPAAAIDYCLQAGGVDSGEIDYVVFYEKPFRKFERLLATYLSYAPQGLSQALVSLPLWIKEKIWIKEAIRRRLPDSGPILFCEHHRAHAASAFFPSPFTEAAYLTIDGVGEFATTSFGTGSANRLTSLGELSFPHSLGLLYAAFTAYCGFRINADEYKLMGLAPYGAPRYRQEILEHLIDLREDGSFRLNMDFFSYTTSLRSTNARFEALFGGPPRDPLAPISKREMDLARSIQDVTEEVFLRMARHVHHETGHKALCLAGGVTLNCVANGRLEREGPFERLWIQPAAGDAGAAIGAALWGWHQFLEQPRSTPEQADAMQGAYLGPSFDEQQIELALKERGADYHRLEEQQLLERSATLLDEGKVIGWFQGRMEFGPRALGNRSILADPRPAGMQSLVNRKIKFREDFRPFAPAIREERVADYFTLEQPSPYMLLVAPVHPGRLRTLSGKEQALRGLARLGVPRSEIPAVTHVDNSARVQTVNKTSAPLFYRLLEAFEQRSGLPLLLNTSFNVSEEPIVCTPEQAYRCFMTSDLDALAIGPFLLEKDRQPQTRTTAEDNKVYAHPQAVRQKPERRQLRHFALLLGGLSLCFGAALWLRAHPLALPLLAGGLLLPIAGVVAPNALSPPYRLWMALGRVAGWLTSRLMLTLFYLLALWPTALLARLAGKRFLELSPDSALASYWEPYRDVVNDQVGGLRQY